MRGSITVDNNLDSCCGHSDEAIEVAVIKAQAELYGMEITQKCTKKEKELSSALYENGDFDYIYLSSHGDNCGFENESKTLNMSWTDFGTMVCNSQCLKSEGTFQLLGHNLSIDKLKCFTKLFFKFLTLECLILILRTINHVIIAFVFETKCVIV